MAKTLLICWIFFCSGVAGLIYEVLWMKQLGLLFGNTAQSVAAATAAFFIGIAAGSYVWGERLRHVKRPLRTYAWLEFGIIGAALLYFLLFEAWTLIYRPLFASLGDWPAVFTATKLLLAILLICPATFLMGGTLPVMGQYLVRETTQLGRWSGWLYGINTLGAAGGALLAGFFLPQWLGFNNTYLIALSISFIVAVVAFYLSHNEVPEKPLHTEHANIAPPAAFEQLQLIAFVSGFTSLALQVLWTRMFVQVLQNSVYTFAAILATFLLSLALGALLSRLLAKYAPDNITTLMLLLCLSALAVLLVPFGFFGWTDGLRYLGDDAQLPGYLLQIFSAVAVLVGIPTVVMGTLLPYLYKYAEASTEQPGVILGRLNGLNTFGAVLGSLCAGFILLEWLGLWRSLRLMAFIYLLTAVFIYLRQHHVVSSRLIYVPLTLLLLSVTCFDPGRLPVVRIQPIAKNEALLEVREGSGGTVAVVKQKKHLRVKLNNWYSLGGSGAIRMEQMQSHLPLNLHPNAKSVFYLGLGSGITAGGAMTYPVERVVIAELVDEVIAASRKYFTPYTQGLFDDSRVQIVHEDGRNYLRATRETYDLIIADLFIPWKSGVGYLYTQEHFTAAKMRLNPHGLFVQWIPLYQISARELGIISKTLLAVFPQVTLWRGDFYANKPMLALIGHQQKQPLSAATPIVQISQQSLQDYRQQNSDQVPLLAHYLGQLSSQHPLLADQPLNTDDLPWIEYLAPQSHRAEKAGDISWFTGDTLVEFMQQLQQKTEPVNDPYLQQLNADMHRTVYAGLFFHLAQIAREQEKEVASRQAMAVGKALLEGRHE